MNAKEFCNAYGFTVREVMDILKAHNIQMNPSIDYSDPTILSFFQDAIAKAEVRIAEEEARKAEAEARRAEEEARRAEEYAVFREAAKGMLITSGFTFDGYTIKKYSGYISGDDSIEIDRDDLVRITGPNSTCLTDALVKIRRTALEELQKAAYDLGCNAVIGVDFDYMTFEPETILNNGFNTTHYYMPYVVCVTANGNAVVIEKDE